MSRRALRAISFLGLLLLALSLPIEEVEGLAAPRQTDAAIRKALQDISAGKIPPNDDRLIALIEEDLTHIAAENSADPSVAVDAVGRAAQGAVAKVTAAYTAAIFRTSTSEDAQQLFGRFQNTVDRVVGIVKGDSSDPGTDSGSNRSNNAGTI